MTVRELQYRVTISLAVCAALMSRLGVKQYTLKHVSLADIL